VNGIPFVWPVQGNKSHTAAKILYQNLNIILNMWSKV
jgi:hypothetical protein